VAALNVCPSCSSPLLQPLRSRASKGDEVMVDLRCPECNAWLQLAVRPAEAEELDRAQADGRRELVDAYHRSVIESMESLAFCLHIALDQDLVGADDFAPRSRAA
jgi:uncharacterized protein with PIN domain